MQCQKCNQRAATIHLTEIVDGKRSEMHLCEICAQKEGIAIKSQIPLNQLLSTLLAVSEQPDAANGKSTAAVDNLGVCPQCGMTWEKFARQSLLGCPNDYAVFEKPLRKLIEKAHSGNLTHRGKIPAGASVDAKKQAELSNLRHNLDKAVKKEDYEKAAQIRDTIDKLEKWN